MCDPSNNQQTAITHENMDNSNTNNNNNNSQFQKQSLNSNTNQIETSYAALENDFQLMQQQTNQIFNQSFVCFFSVFCVCACMVLCVA